MRKILITGVIGRQVVPALVQSGHQVNAVTRSPQRAAAVTEASNNLASAVIAAGVGTYFGESTTFQYLDAGSDWIDEAQPRNYHSGSAPCADAEAAAQQVTDAGLVGVICRFAMFHASDSGHIGTFQSIAKRGFSPFIGPRAGYQSFVDSSDAARAVVAALDVAPGIYNVAEPNPTTRAEHAAELARLLGRKKLRVIPQLLAKAGGEAAGEMCRSQRISSRALQEAGAWEPRVDIVTRWKELA